MRISTSQLYQQSANAILDQQAKLAKTQQQVSSGMRITSPADDPVGAVQALDLNAVLAQTKLYQENAGAARDRLRLEEGTLTGVTDLLQRARELAVQGNNAPLSNSDRASLASELRERLNELVGLANTRDANGEYLFSGHQSRTAPFSRNASGAVTYGGDQGGRYLQIGPAVQVVVGDSGSEVFQAIRNGNGTFVTAAGANSGSGVIDPGSVSGTFVSDTYTIAFTQVLPSDPITYSVTGAVSGVVVPAGTAYTSGAAMTFNGVKTGVSGTPANGDTFTVSPSANQSIFTTLQNLINVLGTPAGSPASQANLNNGINRSLKDIDQSLDHILETRARIGARLNALDSQSDMNDAFALQLQETLSKVQDLDYAEAVTRMQQQLTGLQAAQQAFAKVEQLSLFNYL